MRDTDEFFSLYRATHLLFIIHEDVKCDAETTDGAKLLKWVVEIYKFAYHREFFSGRQKKVCFFKRVNI